jgi:head-tail adaptor
MFGHSKICTVFTPKDKRNPTPAEQALQDVITAFSQLRKDRERADYAGGWRLVETDVRNAIRLAEDVFAKWRKIKDEDIARHPLLSMFSKSDPVVLG